MNSRQIKKTVVITGGSGVLGRTMAKHFLMLGAKVAILGRNRKKAESVATQISATETNRNIIGLSVDVLNKESLTEAKMKVNERFGPCEILINAAGGNAPEGTTSKSFFHEEDIRDKDIRSFFDLSQEGLQYVSDLNYLGTLLPTQVFARDMIGKEGCSVLNVSSMSAYLPLTKVGAYSNAKAAINNLTQWLAVHFSKVNIRVNAIAPGFFITEQNRRLLTNEDGSLTERGQQVIARTPMDRFGDPEELLGAVEWLCSDSAKFVTGIIVPVDGGFSAYSGV